MNYHAPLTVDPIHGLAEAMSAHPRFEDAAVYYFDNVSEWRRELGFFENFLSTYARNIILAYLCFLHFANPTGRPEDGATFTRIESLVARRKDCGPRALRTVLGIVVLAGYFRKERSPDDRRNFAYVPTPKLLKQYSIHLGNTMKCFDILLGETAFAGRGSDPSFIERLMRSSGKAAIENDIMFAEVEPALLQVARMTGGLPTLIAFARARIKGEAPPTLSVLDSRYKVRPSQARAVIAYALQNGLLTASANGAPTATPEGLRLVKLLLARELALYGKYTLGLEDTFMPQRGTPA